jgi:hypothetical protein
MAKSITKKTNLLCCILNPYWQCLDCKAVECDQCGRDKDTLYDQYGRDVGEVGHFGLCPTKDDFWLISSPDFEKRMEERGIKNV